MRAPLTSQRPSSALHAPSEIEQYSKWFEMNNMDFALVRRGEVWRCVAWERSDVIGDESYGDFPSVMASTQVTGFARDLTTAMSRCYEAIRKTQRSVEATSYGSAVL